MVDKAAQELLFTIQRAGDQADWAWLAMATDLTPIALDSALRQLYDLSLVHLQRNEHSQPIYAIRRLTSTFRTPNLYGAC